MAGNTIGTAYIQVAPNMSGIQGKIAGGLRGSGEAFASQFGSEVSGKSAVIIGALAGVAQAGVTKAMSLVTQSISSAVKRVDTLNAAQKTFQYMGFAANDAADATKAVTKSILGLPTPLDSAIRGMTSLAATYQDVKLGQKVFTALNDAILGFGGSAEMVDNAIMQLSQLPLDGPLDAQTWNSLRNSGLTPVLVAMSKDFGRSVSQMKEDFGSGKLKVQDFVNELTKLDTQGGGGLVRLQDIALNATSGISTGFANMQTAVSRGLAKIIQAVGQKNISNAISQIGTVFEKALTAVAKAIPIVVKHLKDLVSFIVKYKDIFTPIAVGAAAASAALTALFVVSKGVAAFKAIQAAVKGAQLAMFTYNATLAQGATAMQAFNIATGANPLGIIIVSLAAVTAALVYFFTKTETGRKIFASFADWLSRIWEKVKAAIQAAADFLGSAWDASVGVVTDAFNKVKDTIKAVFDAVAGYIEEHKKGLRDIAIVITTIVLPKMVLIGVQAGIAAARAVAAWVVIAAGAIKNAAITSAAWVVSAAKSAAAFVAKIPGMIAQFAIASAAAAVHAAKVAASWALSSAKTLASWATTFAGYLVQMAVVVAQTAIAAARMAASWLLALGPIGAIVAAVVGAVALIIANWDRVGPFFTGVWNTIKNAVSAVFDWIKTNWPLILAVLTGPIGLAVLFINKNWQAIKDGAANVVNSLVSFFGGLPGRIMGAIGNLGNMLYGVGRDMIQGLLNGAGSLLGRIGQFFLDRLPSWIVGPFKKALGIRSPSKVFAGFGGNIAQGLANGIDSSSSNVTKAVSSMADSAIAGMSGSTLDPNFSYNATAQGAAPSLGGNSTTNQTVNIQKIVLGDESAVKELFKQLNRDTISVDMGMTPNQGAMV